MFPVNVIGAKLLELVESNESGIVSDELTTRLQRDFPQEESIRQDVQAFLDHLLAENPVVNCAPSPAERISALVRSSEIRSFHILLIAWFCFALLIPEPIVVLLSRLGRASGLLLLSFASAYILNYYLDCEEGLLSGHPHRKT